MKYFLAKTDPETYSIDDLERDKKTVWDGVKNPQALRAIREMQPGDKVFVYHSMADPQVVGLAEVASAPRPDPRNPKLTVVDRAPGSAGDPDRDQGVSPVRRLGLGAAEPAVDDAGAGGVCAVDAEEVSDGEDLNKEAEGRGRNTEYRIRIFSINRGPQYFPLDKSLRLF